MFGSVALFSNSFHSGTQFNMLPFDRIPEPQFEQPYAMNSKIPHVSSSECQPTAAEQIYAINLKHYMRNSERLNFWRSLEHLSKWSTGSKEPADVSKNSSLTTTTSGPARSRDIPTNQQAIYSSQSQFPSNQKFRFIKDLEVRRYADIIGKVVKLYPGSITADLYVTDYTSNNLLYDHKSGSNSNGDEYPEREGDRFGYLDTFTTREWKGPNGTFTLAVTLWDNQAAWACANVNEGDFVFLRNVHIKLSQANKLEGAIHKDQRYPDQIDIRVLSRNDARLAPLKANMAKYEDASGRAPEPISKRKRKAESKKEKKRLEQQQRECHETIKPKESAKVVKRDENLHGTFKFFIELQ